MEAEEEIHEPLAQEDARRGQGEEEEEEEEEGRLTLKASMEEVIASCRVRGEVFNPFDLELEREDQQQQQQQRESADEEEHQRSRLTLKKTMEEVVASRMLVYRVRFSTLYDINWEVAGLSQIVSGQWGSADFSELIVGSLMPSLLEGGGECRIVSIDRTMPSFPRGDGRGHVAGRPDLVMVRTQGESPIIMVSVKRYKVYRKGDDPHELASRILLKSYLGMREYLKAFAEANTDNYIVILVENREDASRIYLALQEIPAPLAAGISLRIIVVDETCGEARRMIFHYTREDVRQVRVHTRPESPDIFNDRSWIPIPTDIDPVDGLDVEDFCITSLTFPWDLPGYKDPGYSDYK